MSSARNALALAALLALAGCGFHPLYAGGGPDGGPGGENIGLVLNTIAVDPIPDRQGQVLRQALETRLDVAGAPVQQRYRLVVGYAVISQAAGLQADTSTSYNRFVATATWTLSAAGDPAGKIASGTANSVDSDNTIDQQYFAQNLETGTINRQLADTLSQQIVDQIALYFRAHPPKPG